MIIEMGTGTILNPFLVKERHIEYTTAVTYTNTCSCLSKPVLDFAMKSQLLPFWLYLFSSMLLMDVTTVAQTLMVCLPWLF